MRTLTPKNSHSNKESTTQKRRFPDANQTFGDPKYSYKKKKWACQDKNELRNKTETVIPFIVCNQLLQIRTSRAWQVSKKKTKIMVVLSDTRILQWICTVTCHLYKYK